MVARECHIFRRIRNSIDSEVISLINHWKCVKEYMDYMDFLQSGKGNISRMCEVNKAFYRPKKHDRSFTTSFMEFKKTYEWLNMSSFNTNIKVQKAHREAMVVMSFMAGIPSEFDTTKSQFLSCSGISIQHHTFSRILHIESSICLDQ